MISKAATLSRLASLRAQTEALANELDPIDKEGRRTGSALFRGAQEVGTELGYMCAKFTNLAALIRNS